MKRWLLFLVSSCAVAQVLDQGVFDRATLARWSFTEKSAVMGGMAWWTPNSVINWTPWTPDHVPEPSLFNSTAEFVSTPFPDPDQTIAPFPDSLVVVAHDGSEIMRIDLSTSKITIREGAMPDAAKAFADALKQYLPPCRSQ